MIRRSFGQSQEKYYIYRLMLYIYTHIPKPICSYIHSPLVKHMLPTASSTSLSILFSGVPTEHLLYNSKVHSMSLHSQPSPQILCVKWHCNASYKRQEEQLAMYKVVSNAQYTVKYMMYCQKHKANKLTRETSSPLSYSYTCKNSTLKCWMKYGFQHHNFSLNIYILQEMQYEKYRTVK